MTSASTVARRLAIPGVGIALVSSWVAGMAYVYSAGSSLRAEPSLLSHALFVPKAMAHVGPLDARGQTVLLAASSVATAHGGALALVARSAQQTCSPVCDRLVSPAKVDGKTVRTAAAETRGGGKPAKNTIDIRFDTVAASAALSPQKLASLFARSAALETPTAEADDARFADATVTAEPSADRFGAPAQAVPSSYILALAVPDADPFAADDLMASVQTEDEAAVDPFALPSPEEVPVPGRRPAVAKNQAPVKADDAIPAPGKKAGPAATKKPETVVTKRIEEPRSPRQAPVALAYAPPDDGAGGVGKAFKNLFNTGPSAVGGKGVAVYNISAGTVTMPNGEVLEAHSGIGNMADNPKYAGVKMRGPTPPDTYKLKMRESRFHGVEAIRMLPTDGKVKLGRTGILAHTELLRGRKGQSHGCVAFKDYARFLAAFKKGKVTHMVVIAGNGRGKAATTRVASNDNSRT